MGCVLCEDYDPRPYYIIRPCLEHNLGVESTRILHIVRETLPGRECAGCLVNHLPDLRQQEVMMPRMRPQAALPCILPWLPPRL